MSRWKLSEQSFENFSVRGRFSKKTQKFLKQFNVLRHQAAITTQWLQIAGNSLPNNPSTGCLVCIFAIRINSKSFPFAIRSVQETDPNFRQRPMSDIGWTKYAAVLAGWPTWNKNRLNWKLKISNTADNADITHRRNVTLGIVERRKLTEHR